MKMLIRPSESFHSEFCIEELTSDHYINGFQIFFRLSSIPKVISRYFLKNIPRQFSEIKSVFQV